MKKLITCLVVCVMSGAAFAETWTVDDDGKADFNNIQDAIDAASDGDEIVVMPGTYTSTGDQVVNMLGKAVWLHSSNGPNSTIIDGQNARKCMLINSGESNSTIVEGFTLTNGSTSDSGGGLACYSSSPTITNCVLSNNFAGWGGGANTSNSDILLTDCVFLNNTAVHDGGGMYIGPGSSVLTNCSFIGNSAQQNYGGGVRTSDCTPSFIECTFEGNSGGWGGAIMNGGAAVATVTGCTFSGNNGSSAGGIFNQTNAGGASSIISNSIFCENTPIHIYGDWTDAGGNCFADICDDCIFDSAITVDDDGKADFDNIQAAVDAAVDGDEILVYPGTYTSTGDQVVNMLGKAVWLHSSNGPNSTIIDGQNARKCMLINSGESNSTIVEGFTLTNGSTSDSGGGLACYSSSPTITNCVLSNNFAGWGGGANTSNSDILLTDCVFLNNTAVHDGGGMYIGPGSSVLTNCSFIGNSAQQNYGGGVRTSDCTPSFIECTFEGNSGGWGGAIMNGGAAVATVTGCTFSGNNGSSAGGIFNQTNAGGASSIISNSIFCENTPIHIYGDWTDAGGNCFADICDDGNDDGYPDDCQCIGDIEGDGSVDVGDLLLIIDYWGSTNPAGDLNGDGSVNVTDLLIVVGNWGPCE